MSSKEVAIALDFGMTGSGMAYQDSDLKIRQVQWPRGQDEWLYTEKVPTAISYDQGGRILGWGKECDNDTSECRILFKNLLDPIVWQTASNTEKGAFKSLGDVRTCVETFLTALFQYTVGQICPENPAPDLLVNLILTYPTTWRNSTVVEYQQLAEQAFRNISQKTATLVTTALITEPHAAGIFASTRKLFRDQLGTIILVEDIGGATTDPAFLQVERDGSFSNAQHYLQPISDPILPGARAGCTSVDHAFQQHVFGLICANWKNNHGVVHDEVLSSAATIARKIRLSQEWEFHRRSYSADTILPDREYVIPEISGPGEQSIPATSIWIQNTDMEVFFNAPLLLPITHTLDNALYQLDEEQRQRGRGTQMQVAQLFLCGGGGMHPRVCEHVRDHPRFPDAPIQITHLLAPTLGALYHMRDTVQKMVAEMKVGVISKKQDQPNFKPSLFNQSLQKATFSKLWREPYKPTIATLSKTFVLQRGGATESWSVELATKDFIMPSRPVLELLHLQHIYFRICLTLPQFSDKIAARHFSAYQACDNRTERAVGCTATRIE